MVVISTRPRIGDLNTGIISAEDLCSARRVKAERTDLGRSAETARRGANGITRRGYLNAATVLSLQHTS